MVLQALSNFFARSVHGQRGDIGAQADSQVPALAGFKPAALLFEPSFELGAGQIVRLQQMCCDINKDVVAVANFLGFYCSGYPRISLNVRFHRVFVKKCAITSTM